MKLRIGISPCPNDTFIFDALYSGSLASHPFEFEFVFEDVETLNEMALKHELDIVKLSYANYFRVTEHYIMMRSGGAMGMGVGPLLVAGKSLSKEEIDKALVAIPGEHTTANFLLCYAYPNITQKKQFVFSEIEQALLQDNADAGVLIHENRFTYEQKGLKLICDLGSYWESTTGLPIPLGGIAIRRQFTSEIYQAINELIRQSIFIARERYPLLSHFIVSHAQDMDEDIIRRHIELYVNEFSIDPGDIGLEAVRKMAQLLKFDSSLPLFH